MISKVSIIVLLLQVAWIQARTADDVIQDFEPAFVKIHNQFYKLENSTKSRIYPLFEQLDLALDNSSTSVNECRDNIIENIEKNVWEILQENGMVENIELIPHCLTSLNNSVDSLISKSVSEEPICVSNAQQENETLSLQFQALLVGFQGEHVMLEFTKTVCRRREDPFDVQECLIYDLYGFYPNYVVHNINQLNRLTELLTSSNNDTIDELTTCFYFIERDIKHDSVVLLTDFSNCVTDASKINEKLKE